MIDATNAAMLDPVTGKEMPRIATQEPLSLSGYPAIRQITVTDRDCDLIARLLGISLSQCDTRANTPGGIPPADPIASLSASWLRDEINRLIPKFGAHPT